MRAAVLLITLLSYTVCAQQIVLDGQLSIHNSKYNTGAIIYVENASVIAPFTKPATSDRDGKFTLEFVGLDAGTTVKLAIDKSGLEVVNNYDLQEVILGRKNALRIFLAKKGQLAEAQTELYNISKKALFSRKDKLIARLQKEDQTALAELEAYFGKSFKNRYEAEQELINQIEALEKRLPEFAQKLAQQNLDFASELYIEAYKLFKSGDIEGAITVLDADALTNSYKEAKKAIAEGENLMNQGMSLQEKGRLQLEQTIESYILKAKALYYSFRYAEAVEDFQKVITIYKETGADSLKMAKIYDELAIAYYQEGQYLKALDEQKQAIAIKEELVKADHPELSISYNMVAVIYNRLKAYDKALEYMQIVIENKEKQVDKDDIELAILYNNLSLIYEDMNHIENAYNAQMKSIGIREKSGDSVSAPLATSYSIMGSILMKARYYKESLEYQFKALNIRELQLSANDPAFFRSYSGIAQVYRRMGDYQAAESYYKKALVIADKSISKYHPNLAGTYQGLAVVYQEMGDLEKALETNFKALDVRANNPSTPKSNLAGAYLDIGRIYTDMKDYEKALIYIDKGMALSQQIEGGDYVNRSGSYYTKGLIFQNSKALDSATVYFEKTLKIREENKAALNQIGNVLYRLSQVYTEKGDYKKAKKNLLRVIDIDKGDGTQVSAYLGEDYVAMSKLYLKMKDNENAVAYRNLAHNVMSQLAEKNRRNLVNDIKALDALLKANAQKD